jgi:hypothetical protein
MTRSLLLVALAASASPGWCFTPIGLQRHAVRRRVGAPVALAASAAAHAQHRDDEWTTVRAPVALAAALDPLRRLLSAISRLIGGVLLRWLPRARAAPRVDVVPRDVLAADGARSAANLLVLKSVATRSVPAPDDVLVYFNYRLTPFYAELPANVSVPATAAVGGTVRCLQHRHAQAPSEFQLAADEGRLELLRELYDEAAAQERLQRGAARWRAFSWAWPDGDGRRPQPLPDEGEEELIYSDGRPAGRG